MCGITGIVRWDGGALLEREIEAMTRAIAHRGPDGTGLYVGERVAIGHRRLSIIDPAGGAQPMWDEAREIGITYNGELYNYLDIKEQLVDKGHIFRTRSDTEVVLHAYMEWGADCVSRFRGMFAFGVSDLPRRRLFLARDHFGIKPLYYRRGAGFFAFASEINALRHVGEPCTGSLPALDLFLRYQYIPAPSTILREVQKLPAAHSITVDFDGRESAPRRYWDFRFEPDERTSLEQWVERFDAAVRESVAAHLVSDVPFGVFLSGGVDSSLVAGHMHAILGDGVKGFTIGFEDERISEIRFAEEVAKTWSFDLVSSTMRDDALAELPAMVAQYGEPFGDASMVPTWQVSRLARGRVPMVLSGDGGDECFAGYDSHIAWAQSSLRPYLSALKWAPGLRPALRVLDAIVRRALGRELNDVDMWERFILYLPEAARRSLFRPEHAAAIGAPSPAFTAASAAAQGFDRVAYAQYLDIGTYLPYDILTKVDVASMAHGLEVRTPLIDLRVLDVARQIPAALRMERIGPRLVGKQIPRRALARSLPEAFVNRKKQGFGIPRAAWLRRGGKARELLDQVLGRGTLFDLFREPAVRALVLDHDRGRLRDGALWLLLIFGLWREANAEVRFT